MRIIPKKEVTLLTNFKTRAWAFYYGEVNELNDIKDIYPYIQDIGNYFIVWKGTNVLFAFDMYPGIIIKNNLQGWKYDEMTQFLEVMSGESISKIAYILYFQYRQERWKRFFWLPGTVGGAVVGNAGCFWLEIQHNLVFVEAYNLHTGKIEYFTRKECCFRYRNSFFKEHREYFLLRMGFDLRHLEEKYTSNEDVIHFRKYKQPKGNSCGSFFKNPEWMYSAGALLEKVWLKWFQYKNAYFSEKHANFLMTKEYYWDYRDLLYMVYTAQEKVYRIFWVVLVPEVNILFTPYIWKE